MILLGLMLLAMAHRKWIIIMLRQERKFGKGKMALNINYPEYEALATKSYSLAYVNVI